MNARSGYDPPVRSVQGTIDFTRRLHKKIIFPVVLYAPRIPDNSAINHLIEAEAKNKMERPFYFGTPVLINIMES